MLNKFIEFWNYLPGHIDPVFLQLGQFQIRYYGLMYIVVFTVVYLLVLYRIKNEGYRYSKDMIQDYFVWAVLGVMIGGRFGYVLVYNFDYYIAHPIEIISPVSFEGGIRYTGIGGMSYHGGLIGILLASILFCYKNKINFWHFADLLMPAIPLGYTFGRLGNFINGELYGRVTTMPWGMYFPMDPTRQLRHPSQLYEAFFEGVFLFLILWSIRKRDMFNGFLLSVYLVGYGFVRFFIEFVRQPDIQLGFIIGPFTMGQILSFLMIVGGLAVFLAKRKLKNGVASNF